MKFSELVFDATEIYLPQDPNIESISSSSSRCNPNSLFVCIEGMHRDGHSYISQAKALGACAYIISSSHIDAISFAKENSLAYAIYPDTRFAEAHITSRFYQDPWKKLKIFAVTGTNGKTTVVSLLNAIYTVAGFSCRNIGTLTGKLTTPDPEILYKTLYDYQKDGVQYVFMEASSHALSLGKLSPIIFDVGIFTNLTPEHLDFHKTMEDYCSAKASLFKQSKIGIFNADDSHYLKLLNPSNKPYLCSMKQDGMDFTAKNILQNGSYGIQYDLMTKDLVFKIKSGIPGLFTVMNTLEAASASLIDGISPEIIRGAVCGFDGVKGRLERVVVPTNDFSVYIDFAHTPDALENILRTVRGFMSDGQRLVLIFGCGGDRDKSKRPIMGEIAVRLADFVIVTADNSRSEKTSDIIEDILSGITVGSPHTAIENRKEAIEYAVSTAQRGDIILLTGKGHEEYEIMPDGVHPFSEKSIVIQAVTKYIKARGLF